MKLIDVLLSYLLPALIFLHLAVAPYTKVEESFNIQASHDVLVYGTPTSDVNRKLMASYDHFAFPGPIPRTFIGPVLLAGVSQPIVAVLGFEHAQLVVRSVLGLFSACALNFFKTNIAQAFGQPTARWYVLLQASQFHILYYASRTLPNMFAFGLTTLASAFLLPSPNPKSVVARHRLAISLFVFATAIFRSELAILLGMNVLYLLVIPLSSVNRVISPFVVSFIVSLLLSVPIDSYFWQKPVWPELWGFYYNVVRGSSSNWGVSPWHFYFTSALPRLLLNPLVPTLLIPTALSQPATSRPACHLVIPNLLFVAIYSLQPHKEARFIFYVIPPFTAAASLGANFILTRRNKSALYKAASLALIFSIPLAFAASTAMLLLSSLNYPGGEALASLRAIIHSDPSATAVVPVHADVLSCMTGVTLFGTATGDGLPTHHVAGRTASVVGTITQAGGSSSHAAAAVSLALDKTEDPAVLRDPAFWARFDYVLAEDPAKIRGGRWETVGVVEGYSGVEVLQPGMVPRGQGQLTEDGGVVTAGKVVGRGAVVAAVRERVRSLTGGWWVGPRMVPRIRILRRVKDAEKVGNKGVES